MIPKGSLTCGLLALALTASAAADTLSFEEFKQRPEAALVAEEFLAAALQGDPVGMVVTIHALAASGQEGLAMDLLETTWREVGYRPEQAGPRPRPLRDRNGQELELPKEGLLDRYHDLAVYRLDAAKDPVALERAFRILVENARQGFGLSAGQMGSALSSHPMIPDSFDLYMAWYRFGEEATDFALDTHSSSDAWESPTPPAADAFGQCSGRLESLNGLGHILAELQRTEAAIQAQPDQSEALTKAFYAGIAERMGPVWSSPTTFAFSSLPVPSVLALLLDFGAPEGDQVFTDLPGLMGFHIAADWQDQPVALVLALLDRELGRGGFRCVDEWVRWEPVAGSTPEPFRLLPRPLLSGNPDQAGRQNFVWAGGAEFQGVLDGGYPSGEGQLILRRGGENTALIQSGHFHRGLLHGEGEVRDQDGQLQERGHYRMGRLHGQGWRRSHDGTEIEGEYTDGVLVQGQGRQSLASADSGAAAVEYVGPFVADVPHGIGQCSGAGFSYRCHFHQGNFVGIGDTLLIPQP